MADKTVIQCAPDGPYLVQNPGSLKNSTGGDLPTKEKVALCRCGGSANKPFCDGTHWSIKFTDDKN